MQRLRKVENTNFICNDYEKSKTPPFYATITKSRKHHLFMQRLRKVENTNFLCTEVTKHRKHYLFYMWVLRSGSSLMMLLVVMLMPTGNPWESTRRLGITEWKRRIPVETPLGFAGCTCACVRNPVCASACTQRYFIVDFLSFLISPQKR